MLLINSSASNFLQALKKASAAIPYSSLVCLFEFFFKAGEASNETNTNDTFVKKKSRKQQ